MSLRIAHVSDTLRVGGGETLIAQLCRIFRQQGHDVTAHCLHDGGAVADALRADAFAVSVHGPASRWTITRRLAAEFRRLRPDAVHCHNAAATVIAAPAAHWAGVPVIVSTRHGLVAPPYPWRREVQFSLAARLCRSVVGVCEATTRNLARAPLASSSRLVTVYNGANPAPVATGPLPPRPSCFTLLWVGRLAAPKDPLTLLQAVARVRSHYGQDVALWVIGDGALRPSAEALCRQLDLGKAVTFWGQQAAVGTFLACSDAFVLSSLSEGLPVSLLEAMAAGIPCLGTEVGAMPEVIEGGNCGLIVPPGDVEQMAAAIAAMAAAPDRRLAWGHAARIHYQAHFTLEKMAASYLDLYRPRL